MVKYNKMLSKPKLQITKLLTNYHQSFTIQKPLNYLLLFPVVGSSSQVADLFIIRHKKQQILIYVRLYFEQSTKK